MPPGLVYRVSGLWLRVSGLWLRVWGFGVWGSGFGLVLRVEGWRLGVGVEN